VKGKLEKNGIKKKPEDFAEFLEVNRNSFFEYLEKTRLSDLLLCWEAISQFKAHPTLPAALDILEKFLTKSDKINFNNNLAKNQNVNHPSVTTEYHIFKTRSRRRISFSSESTYRTNKFPI
jgi:hypothetical protein